jgi:hypothetical protein
MAEQEPFTQHELDLVMAACREDDHEEDAVLPVKQLHEAKPTVSRWNS